MAQDYEARWESCIDHYHQQKTDGNIRDDTVEHRYIAGYFWGQMDNSHVYNTDEAPELKAAWELGFEDGKGDRLDRERKS